jgi:cytochrome c oxidase subunit 2
MRLASVTAKRFEVFMQNKQYIAATVIVLYLGLVANPVRAARQDVQTFQLTAKRFEFTPNEVTVKVNQPAVLVFKSEDVTHGMHFDDLDINATIEKGKGAEVKFTPTKTGDFVGHCAVFCGTGHGGMSLTIHVIE